MSTLSGQTRSTIRDPRRDSIAGVNGCLVRVERDAGGVITRSERVCRGQLHHSLSFEPDSFSGNLTEQVDAVCSECWETYVDQQWGSDVEGAELRVEVWGDDGRSEYFAARAEAIRGGPEGAVRLVSENDLKKDVRREEIESITLTPRFPTNRLRTLLSISNGIIDTAVSVRLERGK